MAVDNQYYRLFDANVNRCREGLRVLEDSARFVLDQASSYKQLRALRHRIDQVTRHIYPMMLATREAHRDAGRTMKESADRAGVWAVVAANFRRVEESLRVLEEYSKIVCPGAAKDFKAVRYAGYTLEKIVKESAREFEESHPGADRPRRKK